MVATLYPKKVSSAEVLKLSKESRTSFDARAYLDRLLSEKASASLFLFMEIPDWTTIAVMRMENVGEAIAALANLGPILSGGMYEDADAVREAEEDCEVGTPAAEIEALVTAYNKAPGRGSIDEYANRFAPAFFGSALEAFESANELCVNLREELEQVAEEQEGGVDAKAFARFLSVDREVG